MRDELAIYFAGAVRGGGGPGWLAARIEALSMLGNVLTEHMASAKTIDVGDDVAVHAHDQQLLARDDRRRHDSLDWYRLHDRARRSARPPGPVAVLPKHAPVRDDRRLAGSHHTVLLARLRALEARWVHVLPTAEETAKDLQLSIGCARRRLGRRFVIPRGRLGSERDESRDLRFQLRDACRFGRLERGPLKDEGKLVPQLVRPIARDVGDEQPHPAANVVADRLGHDKAARCTDRSDGNATAAMEIWVRTTRSRRPTWSPQKAAVLPARSQLAMSSIVP